MPKYLVCRRHHDHEGEPVVIYEELDDDRVELRKVQEYADGRLSRAHTINDGDTSLSWVPVPGQDEIDLDQQFQVRALSAVVFQQVRLRAGPAS